MKNINKYKNENGITLIVLIITIIIMLILLSVVVDIAFDGKLLDSSKNAVKINDNKLVKQQGEVDDIITEKDEIDVENKGKLRRIYPGEKAQETSLYIDKHFKVAIIPKGFTVSKTPTEGTIDDGLVIYLIDDKTQEEIDKINWTDETKIATLRKTYDQFVWIPVDDINEMYMCQLEGTDTDGSGKVEYDEYSSCNIIVEKGEAYCTTHNSNLMAGRLYATETGEKFNLNFTKQNYTQGSNLREPDTLSDYDGNTPSFYIDIINQILGTNYTKEKDFKNALQIDYNETVKSVYENKGFYIGRYETSKSTDINTNKIKVVSDTKEGTSSINWYDMYANQKKFAQDNSLGETLGSTMIQGAAYDHVMKFINGTKVKDDVIYDVTIAVPERHGSINQNTGSNTADFVKNIYDLEGNFWTYTLEAYSDYNRILRGRKLWNRVFC